MYASEWLSLASVFTVAGMPDEGHRQLLDGPRRGLTPRLWATCPLCGFLDGRIAGRRGRAAALGSARWTAGGFRCLRDTGKPCEQVAITAADPARCALIRRQGLLPGQAVLA